MATAAVGAWTGWEFELNSEAKEVFHKLTAGLLGVQYVTFAYATQVVNGTNYAFLAKAKTVVPGAQTRVVRINGWVPLATEPLEPVLQHITDIPPQAH